MLACHAGGPGSIPGRCRIISILQLNTFVLLPFKLVQEKTNKTFFFRDKKGLVINQRFAELVQFPMSKLSDFFTQSRYFFRKLRIIEVFSEYNIHNTTSSIRIPFLWKILCVESKILWLQMIALHWRPFSHSVFRKQSLPFKIVLSNFPFPPLTSALHFHTTSIYVIKPIKNWNPFLQFYSKIQSIYRVFNPNPKLKFTIFFNFII